MRPFVERCLACEADAAGTVEPAFLRRVSATIQFGKHN
jgi:hypothetical protein